MFKSILVLPLLVVALSGTPALADPPPRGFELDRFNGSTDPVTEGDITTFHIENAECSTVDYGDGRGESDCLNGNVRSMYVYQPWASLGQSLEYSFDVMIDPSLAYEGYYNAKATGFEPDGWDSNLRLASWEGTFLHNFIYILKASKKAGLTFAGEVCQSPADFGEWVSFSMKVKWTGDEKGWIAVTCDDRYVYVAEGVATNVAPDCYVENQCVPGEIRNPKKILFIAGVQMAGWGHTWSETGHESQFVPIQDDGITVKMRGMRVSPNPELYGPEDKKQIVKLQETLNALGCDVGVADGVVGRKTRLQAISCKEFAEGAMPDALNVATAATFVRLYTAEGVADLPSGRPPQIPDFVVHVAEYNAEQKGRSMETNTFLEGQVLGLEGGNLNLAFHVTGTFAYQYNEFVSLAIRTDFDAGPFAGAIKACEGVRTEKWGDGVTRAVVSLRPESDGFHVPGRDCLLAALPKKGAREYEFILTHFNEIAKGMAADGAIEAITHDGLRIFMDRVARGETTVVR